jgi:hypothetical protein
MSYFRVRSLHGQYIPVQNQLFQRGEDLSKYLKFLTKDIRKNYKKILFFSIQFFIIALYSLFLFLYLFESINKFRLFKDIDSESITAIQIYSKSFDRPEILPTPELENLFSVSDSLSYVTDFIYDESGVGTRLVIGIGGFGRFYGFHNGDEPLLLAGSNVRSFSVGETITIGSSFVTQLALDKRLPGNSSYFNVSGRYINIENLDDSILLLLSYEDFMHYYRPNLYNLFGEGIKRNLLIRGTGNLFIDALVEEINRDVNIEAVPFNASESIELALDSEWRWLAFYVPLIFGAFLFLGLYLVIHIVILAETNLTEYVITLLYGETLSGVFMRMLFFSLSIFTIPVFLVSLIYNGFGIGPTIGFFIQAFVIIIPSCLIALIQYIKLNSKNMFQILRRDV